MKRLTKIFVTTTVFAAPLFGAQSAMADTAGAGEIHTPVNMQAVDELTQSARTALDLRRALQSGDMQTAKAKIDSTLRTLSSAIRKEPTLGLGNWQARTWRNKLQDIQQDVSQQSTANTAGALDRMLREAGFRDI